MFDTDSMRRTLSFLIIYSFAIGAIAAKPLQEKFSKAAFYAVMKAGSMADVDNELALLIQHRLKNGMAMQGPC